jgi:hypothetical protein
MVVVAVVVLVQVEIVVETVVVSTQVMVIVIIILVEVHRCQADFVIREIKMEMIKMIMVMPNQLLVVGEVEEEMEQRMAMVQKTPIDARHPIVHHHVVVLTVVLVDFEVITFLFNIAI